MSQCSYCKYSCVFLLRCLSTLFLFSLGTGLKPEAAAAAAAFIISTCGINLKLRGKFNVPGNEYLDQDTRGGAACLDSKINFA